MKKIIFKSIIFLFLLLPLNCGFKVIDKSKLNNFSIKEISVLGDKRINFKIKNNLIINTDQINQNTLLIELNTKKTKTIKEKNIKNEITKYQILLNVDLKFNLIDSLKEYQSSLTISGDYLVADNHSTTLANEKKLIDYLVENISKKILDNINLKLNDI
jgi:hypothetical protein